MVAYLQKSEGTTTGTSANREVELTATIDGQVKTITEAALRRHLKLEDNGGVTTLPNSEIFEQLALMGAPETSPSRITSSPSLSVQHTPGRSLIEELDIDARISLVPPHAVSEGRNADTQIYDLLVEQLEVFSVAIALADAAKRNRSVETT
ncbi:hypothetical protein Tco_1453331 [Tanacetum coccineum]